MNTQPNDSARGAFLHDWMVEVEKRLGMPPHPPDIETDAGGAADEALVWVERIEERIFDIRRMLDQELRPTVIQGLVDQQARQIAALAAEVQRLREDCKRDLENHEDSEFGKHAP